ncbi:hypothetical protein AZG88_37695 [Rhodococcus sp. LB1]|nr:hypothetical protein AZG88_37695 [Rhodococcus sp. LB1]
MPYSPVSGTGMTEAKPESIGEQKMTEIPIGRDCEAEEIVKMAQFRARSVLLHEGCGHGGDRRAVM